MDEKGPGSDRDELHEPVEVDVDGEIFYFVCRLFDDEDQATGAWARVTEGTGQTWLTCMLVAEPARANGIGLLLFGRDPVELNEHLGLLGDAGTPYLTSYFGDAVRHREQLLGGKEVGEQFTSEPEDLPPIPPDRLK
jgi:alkylation response protein AidB-like acyl-CoA dehydrogenase